MAPTVSYGSETWIMNAKERRGVEIFYMKVLRRGLGVNVIYKMRQTDIRERRGYRRNWLKKD